MNSGPAIIRYTFEDNGFREVKDKKQNDWTLMWVCGSLKMAFYQQMSRY